MLFSPRIGLKSLVALCRRVSMSLESGLDVRGIWAREAQYARGPARSRMAAISRAVNQGVSLADAMAAAGSYFPSLVREMVRVGELTGHLDEVFAQLAGHYQAQIERRRIFLAAIAWPMLQLAASLVVVGFLIWIMGVIAGITGTTIDILGAGLVGNRGLAIYVGILAVVGIALAMVLRAVQRGLVWTRPIQRAVLRVPVLGPALATLALARLAWSMHLTMNTGMELRRALKLSLGATQNARYTDRIPVVDREIARGNSIYDAFCQAGCFPAEFLDNLRVGEHSGRLVEALAVLSRQYQDRARAALAALTTVAGFGVWAIVALLIIALIFRLAMFYIGTIRSLTM